MADSEPPVPSTLGELIYAIEVSATYTEIRKASDEDLHQIAKNAIRAAQIFKDALP